MGRGFLFTFEGIDGCGKSTQINLLSQALTDDGISISVFREPGGTRIAEAIRQVLLNPRNMDMSYESEALLMAASRAQLLRETVIPNLESGKVVLCDRYVDSSLAYQGSGRGLPLEWLRAINRLAFESAVPDITFLLDIAVESAMNRLGTGLRDRMESSGTDFLERVRNGFSALAEENPDRYIVLNGEMAQELLVEKILSHVRKLIL
ncbi:MAG: dTMP kinase [Candidatus Marinimicrobia bacterium]|nr:dTMP kinase [Candidatus Neomarinimicrobiota bacterium]